MTASSALDYDDDELWRLGLFYVNREDPSVVVPRRFGIGWAMNWGNPKSWGLAALLVAAIAAFVVLVEVLFRWGGSERALSVSQNSRGTATSAMKPKTEPVL